MTDDFETRLDQYRATHDPSYRAAPSDIRADLRRTLHGDWWALHMSLNDLMGAILDVVAGVLSYLAWMGRR